MKSLTSILLCFVLTACGMIRFDINGVDHDRAVTSTSTGCMSDSDCTDGKVCATVKGEYPGSCAGTGGAGLLIGAAVLGVAAAAASADGGGQAGPAPASYQQQDQTIYRQDLRGCCSYHGGIDYCSYGALYCKDGWISGCGC